MAHMFVPEGQSTGDRLKRPRKSERVIKVLLPHVLLIWILFSYIAAGAAIFQAIELPHEKMAIAKKIEILQRLYHETTQQARDECHRSLEDYSEWMTESLRKISIAHGEVYAPVDGDDIVQGFPTGAVSPRWTYAAAVLYALGVLTTTGYSYVVLSTTTGKVFAVIYGLIGFPLMFITAADIGKLMSELVSYIYFHWVDRHKVRRSSLGTSDTSETAPLEAPEQSGTGSGPKDRPSTSSVELPAWAIFGGTLTICTLGSFMYMSIEGWSFVDALYFAFNAVTNMTLGDIPVSGMVFAVITVWYVTFGLAVVTMSIDLAQNQLRVLFRKVHYFGRSIKNRFRLLELDEDVREMLRIITAVRRKNPQKQLVTEKDIINYLQQEKSVSSPFPPASPQPRYKLKRKSIAFIPDGIGAIKFVDDEKPQQLGYLQPFQSISCDSINEEGLPLLIDVAHSENNITCEQPHVFKKCTMTVTTTSAAATTTTTATTRHKSVQFSEDEEFTRYLED